ARFGDEHPPHRRGPIRAVLDACGDPGQERLDLAALFDPVHCHTVDPSSASPFVACHHRPGHPKIVRVGHEVEQVPEPRTAVGLGPPVILDLRPRYPIPGDIRPRPGAGVHRRVLRHRSTSYPLSLPPFPMCPALPDSQYYGGSASSRIGRWTTHPATPQHRLHHGRDRSENLPVFTEPSWVRWRLLIQQGECWYAC